MVKLSLRCAKLCVYRQAIPFSQFMYLQNAKTSERPPTPVHAILAKIFSQDLGHKLTQIHQSLVDFGKTDKMMPDLWKLIVEPRSPAVWNGRSPCRGAQLLLACSSALVHFSTRNANLIPGFHYTRAHPLYSPSINFNSNLYRATLQVILELNYAF